MLIVVEVYADASENMVTDVNKKKEKLSICSDIFQ
jgi:hypothetical protein